VSGDLISFGNLAGKHMRALSRRHLTGLSEHAQADPEVIYLAMASLRPCLTREQDDAGSNPDGTVPDPAEWQTTASFVVVFSQRRTGGIWEQRIEAERTEVEPERATEVWPGWHAAPLCAWMAGQLGQASGAGGPPG
jgi:hypothetical protein